MPLTSHLLSVAAACMGCSLLPCHCLCIDVAPRAPVCRDCFHDRHQAALTWLQGDTLARARSSAEAAAKGGAAAQQARLHTQLGRLQAHCERLALELIEQQQVCALSR